MRKRKLEQKQILVGIGAVLFGLAGFTFLVKSTTVLPRASPTEVPLEIKLTNVTESSLSVSWLTDSLTKGFLVLAEDEKFTQRNSFLDDRREQPSSKIHHVTLKNLRPGRTYYFLVGSGETNYDNHGSPYQFTTPKAPQATPLPPITIKGKIVNLKFFPVKDVLVYFSFPASTPISTFTDQNGNFLLNLSNCRSADWSVTYPLQKNEKGYLLALDGQETLVEPVIIKENLTLDQLVLGKAETRAKTEELTPIKPPPQSLQQNLPPPKVQKGKENFLTKVLQWLKRLFTFKKTNA